MNKYIELLSEDTDFNYEKEFENIIFNLKRLQMLLAKSTRINKADREIFTDALEILGRMYGI